MTLPSDLDSSYLARGSADLHNSSTSWNILYCSHLFENSDLRRNIFNAPYENRKLVKYCYTCRGKVRKYQLRSSREEFTPRTHSTPKRRIIEARDVSAPDCLQNSLDRTENDVANVQNTGAEDPRGNNVVQFRIPTISQQVDVSFRQKYSSPEMQPNRSNRDRLRKSIKRLGCVISLKLTDSPVKKRTQIQACSISVMVAAIVAISFVLVNLNKLSVTNVSNNVVSKIVVPTSKTNLTTSPGVVTTTPGIQDIQMHPLVTKKKEINTNLLERNCSCINGRVCMLHEDTGTAICVTARDHEDPTGCGGLCAVGTERCVIVHKNTGLRVCQLLNAATCNDQFQCRNSLCVPADARCDGRFHCYDRSDEIDCECDLTTQFRCGRSISCFPNSKKCDSVVDCWDGFDEVNCTEQCPPGKFTCTNGDCVPMERFCDGFADCDDRSDEPQGCDLGCNTREFHCSNRRCIPETKKCNGKDDCGDRSDEAYCS